LTLSLSAGLRKLYMCISAGRQRTRALWWASYIAATVMLLGAFILLVVAAIFTPPGRSKLGIIMSYFLQVHMVSFFQQFLVAALRFVHRYHLSVHIAGWMFLSIGDRFCEFILREGLVENVDYRHWHLSLYKDYIFHIDYIYPVCELTDSTSRGSHIGYGRSKSVIFQVNPLHQLARGRSVMILDLIKKKPKTPLYVASEPSPKPFPVEPVYLEMSQVSSHRRERAARVIQRFLRMATVIVASPVAFTHPPPPPPPLPPTASVEPDETDSSVVNDDDDVEMTDIGDRAFETEDMEDLTISLKKFKPQIRNDYKDKFHFWQARMKGYINAENIEQSEIHLLQKVALSEDSIKSPSSKVSEDANQDPRAEVQAIAFVRRGSVMNTRQQFEQHKKL